MIKVELIERGLVWIAVAVVLALALVTGARFVPEPLRDGLSWPFSHRVESGPSITLAEHAAGAHDRAAALRYAHDALVEHSGNAAIAARAGSVAAQVGDFSTAQSYYLEGQVDDPAYPWNYAGLANVYIRRGETAAADAQLRSAIAAAPDAPLLHYQLGEVELRERLDAAAYTDFEAEVKRSPSFGPAKAGMRQALAIMRSHGLASASVFMPKPRQPAPAPTEDQALAKIPPAPEVPISSVAPATALPEPPAGAQGAPVPNAQQLANVRPVAKTAPRPAAAAHRPAVAEPAHHDSLKVVALAPAATARTPAVAAPPRLLSPAALSAIALDAKSYLLGQAQDFNFTRALPTIGDYVPTRVLEPEIASAAAPGHANGEVLLHDGIIALESGRLSLASTAFAAAERAAPSEWRAPYYAGLTAQAMGDNQKARSEYSEAARRAPRVEAHTSLALLDLADGNVSTAADEARISIGIDPAFGPAHFVAAVMALLASDVTTARSQLQSSIATGGSASKASEILEQLNG